MIRPLRQSALMAFCMISFLLSACGRKGDPLPPPLSDFYFPVVTGDGGLGATGVDGITLTEGGDWAGDIPVPVEVGMTWRVGGVSGFSPTVVVVGTASLDEESPAGSASFSSAFFSSETGGGLGRLMTDEANRPLFKIERLNDVIMNNVATPIVARLKKVPAPRLPKIV